MSNYKYILDICMGSSCFLRGNNEHVELIKNFILEKNLKDKVLLKGSLCECKCDQGPHLKINDKVFSKITKESLLKILNENLK